MKRARLYLTLALLALARVPAFGGEPLQEVIVNPGDTMWSIANRYLKDPQRWPDIVKYNKLPTADPTLALPGTRIQVPVTLIKEEYRNAQLIRLTPEVRYKRRDESEWKDAIVDMTLKYEDSLRTMKGGQARVLFATKEEVQINENSYVVLKPEKMQQEIQMVQGDVRASRAKVIMPGGAVIRPRGAGSDYQAKVREDKSSVVFVYKGEVDVTAQGQTVRVREGFGTQVAPSAPPSEPKPLPNFKDFNPADLVTQAPPVIGSSIVSDKRAAEAQPAAAPSSPPAGRSKSMISENIMVTYVVQLAKTPKFDNIVFEKTENIGHNFDIKKEKIPDGSYVMRISFIDAFGVRGAWSTPTPVIKDTSPPEMLSLVPENNQRFMGEESYCDVVGTVKDAAMVSVNGDLVFLTPAGRFTKFVTLAPGKNIITVVARDTQGNEIVVQRAVDYTPSSLPSASR